MNLALMGSVSSSSACLEALVDAGVEVVGVLGLDPAVGANVSDYRDLGPIARRAGIAYRSFRKVTEPEVEAFLRERKPDLLWVIGLSQLVPQSLIELTPGGGVGFHPTQLPRGRGRAPVAWTILLGEPAAVSLFFLTEEPDAGDIIAQREVPVPPDDYSEDLIARTNVALKEVVNDLAPAIRGGVLPRRPQEHSQATYYPKRGPEDGLIDWTQPTDAIYRLVRAASRPYPGAFTWIDGAKRIVWRAKPVNADQLLARERNATTGEVLRVEPTGTWVRTADGALWITETAGGELRAGMRLGNTESKKSSVREFESSRTNKKGPHSEPYEASE